ncbi:hypothetical protein A4U53_006380 (plasmid) [Rhizobium ruizarguesonis]|uniref:Integral membrane protein n=2 Tax=Rhizobium TaxID=379 RepID=A0A179BNM3_RHILE|nr:hypothetical protein [Rhizobium leguminosarum]OAP92900.1 hypothetical protein A4U53_25410 [Rhizobium leguminosarum]
MAAPKGKKMFSAEKYLDTGGVVVGAIILSIVVLFLIIQEVREILFYKRNNWNFDVDSNVGLRLYNGDSTDEKDLVSNKSRVCFGTPFMIFGFGVLLTACVAIILSK